MGYNFYNIEKDIENGLKMKAVVRLKSLINQYPDIHEFRIKLAELFYESGFYDEAGKYWMLAEPAEQRIVQCIEVYKASVNYSGAQILSDIKFRGDKTALPHTVQETLKILEQDSLQKAGHIPDISRRNTKLPENAPVTFTDKVIQIFTGLIILYVIGCLLYGVVFILNLIKTLVFD